MTEPTTYPDNEQNCHKDWPPAVSELAGSWTEFPLQEVLLREQGKDIPREPL
jgi:hypothetical protein